MPLDNPTIAIIGAGALGSYYGARLAQHGANVHFLLRSEYASVKQNGLTIKSCRGDFILPPEKINVHDDPNKMPKADLALITIKSTANDQLPRLIAPIIKEDTILLTLQNGLGNEAFLARHFGQHRVLGGIAFVCINRTAPATIDHSAHGLIRIGELTATPTPRLQKIADLMNASNIQCEILPTLMQGRWEKLLWNIPFNGLSAALDQTTDRLLASPTGIALVTHIMQDVITAAAADGITLDPALIQTNIEKTRNMGAYYTSSHIDRQQNRPLELQALFALPLQAAKNKNRPTPWLEMLYHQLTIVDAKQNP